MPIRPGVVGAASHPFPAFPRWCSRRTRALQSGWVLGGQAADAVGQPRRLGGQVVVEADQHVPPGEGFVAGVAQRVRRGPGGVREHEGVAGVGLRRVRAQGQTRQTGHLMTTGPGPSRSVFGPGRPERPLSGLVRPLPFRLSQDVDTPEIRGRSCHARRLRSTVERDQHSLSVTHLRTGMLLPRRPEYFLCPPHLPPPAPTVTPEGRRSRRSSVVCRRHTGRSLWRPSSASGLPSRPPAASESPHPRRGPCFTRPSSNCRRSPAVTAPAGHSCPACRSVPPARRR